MAYLAGIYLYPIKALDGVARYSATLLTSGALKYDRQWALFDEEGKFVNGKNNSKVHLIRTAFAPDFKTVSLQVYRREQTAVFNLNEQRGAIEAWFQDYFGFPVKLRENTQTGYPDDLNANGPTIISTATIETVASWFPNISVAEMRSRLRANLEIGGVPAFWEDRLFDREDNSVPFQIGNVLFSGINPCQRCVVPTRDTLTGKADPQFTKRFIAKRRQTLPSWTKRDRFDRFYRLSVNTKVWRSQVGKAIGVGDEVVEGGSSRNNLLQ